MDNIFSFYTLRRFQQAKNNIFKIRFCSCFFFFVKSFWLSIYLRDFCVTLSRLNFEFLLGFPWVFLIISLSLQSAFKLFTILFYLGSQIARTLIASQFAAAANLTR